MSTNDLKIKTGLYNNAFYRGKDYLNLSEFIKDDPNPKHKQKKIISLTESGQYFAKLLINFKKFKENLNKFNDKIKSF